VHRSVSLPRYQRNTTHSTFPTLDGAESVSVSYTAPGLPTDSAPEPFSEATPFGSNRYRQTLSPKPQCHCNAGKQDIQQRR